jgi:hypothetical protein
MGFLGIVWKVFAVAFLAIIGLSAYLYFSDYEAKATVTERGSDAEGNYVVIKPDSRLIPYEHKAYIEDANAYRFVCEGYKVTIAIKSLHYQVFDTKGSLVYDSASGVKDITAAAQCGASNTRPGFAL